MNSDLKNLLVVIVATGVLLLIIFISIREGSKNVAEAKEVEILPSGLIACTPRSQDSFVGETVTVRAIGRQNISYRWLILPDMREPVFGPKISRAFTTRGDRVANMSSDDGRGAYCLINVTENYLN